MTTIIDARDRAGAIQATSREPGGGSARRSGREGAVAAILACGWMLGPGRPGGPLHAGVALALALAFALLARPSSRRGLPGRLALAVAHLVTVVLAMSAAQSGLARWEERGPRLAAASQASSVALNLLGYRSAAERGLLLVDHPDGLVTLAPSLEKLAAGPFLIFWVSWAVLRAVRGGSPSGGGLVVGLAIALAAGLARFLATLLIYVEHDQILVGDSGLAALGLFGSPWTVAPFLLIAGLALDRVVRDAPPVTSSGRAPRRHGEVLAAGAAMLGVGGVVGLCWSFAPAGAEKAGRILIDDRFCGIWEPTARRLDTQWYGDFPTYSFTSLAEWLGKWFAVDANIGKPYDDELLSRYDVLVIKTPEEAIPDREAEAIERFVRRGGGLLLVGDHTNLLGMGTHLNTLSAKHGITFKYDSVSNAETGGFVNCAGTPVGRHVGALHVEHLEFMTSCSLQLTGPAETVIAADGCRREPHDYASSSFFGRHGPHPELEHGRTVLAATTRVGRGRIAAFTDSTVWSSFAVFEKDREKLAMDLIRLLNREASPYELPIRAFAVAGLLLAIPLGVRLARSGLVTTALFFGLLGGWSGVAASEYIHRWAYAWPPPNSRVDEVSFLWQGGACAFPPVLGSIGSLAADRCFDTLLVSVQRLGLVPRVAYTYDSDLLRPETRAMFVVSPVEVPPSGTIERLRVFVREGGHLVVLDDFRHGERGSAKAFLAAFDVPITYHAAGDGGEAGRPHVHLGGGMGPIAVPATDAFAAGKSFGRGQVVYLSDAADFSRKGLGHCFARPWKAARARYETIYSLLRDVLGVAPADRRSYGIVQ